VISEAAAMTLASQMDSLAARPALAFLPTLPATPKPLAVSGRAMVAVGLAIFAWYMTVGPLLLSEPDMLWHIETGRRILETHKFPTVDSYSWTLSGAPWIAKEWGAQVLYALAQKFGGWIGVVALASAAVTAAMTLLFAELSRRLPLAWSLGLTLAAIAVADHVVVARPHVLAWPLFVGWTILLLRAAEQARTPPLWSLALMVVWTNLHGSFLIGLALIAPFALEAVLRAQADRRVGLVLRWALFAALTLLAALAHAYGPGVLTSAFSVLDLGPALKHINEWKQQDFSHPSVFEAFVIGGGAAALFFRPKIPLPRLLLLAILLHMGFAHIRHQSLFAFVAVLTLAGPIGERLGGARPVSGWLERRLPLAPLTGGLLVAVALFNAAQSPIYRPVPHATPEKALAAARAAGVTGPVFNKYYFGGFLISQGVPTFIDGRAEFFGARRIEAYYAGIDAADPEKMRRFVDDNGFAWTLLQPEDAAVAALDRLDGWSRLYADEFAVIHVRAPKN
jgi:hypothetical protein